MTVRPIDGNALHTVISAWPESIMYKDWVQSAIATAPTLPQPSNEALPGWVSVEERLPEEDKPVLCIVSGKPRSNIILDEAYQLGSWNYADGWMIDEWPDWEDAAVAWWRELPPPPDRRPPEGEENT